MVPPSECVGSNTLPLLTQGKSLGRSGLRFPPLESGVNKSYLAQSYCADHRRAQGWARVPPERSAPPATCSNSHPRRGAMRGGLPAARAGAELALRTRDAADTCAAAPARAEPASGAGRAGAAGPHARWTPHFARTWHPWAASTSNFLRGSPPEASGAWPPAGRPRSHLAGGPDCRTTALPPPRTPPPRFPPASRPALPGAAAPAAAVPPRPLPRAPRRFLRPQPEPPSGGTRRHAAGPEPPEHRRCRGPAF